MRLLSFLGRGKPFFRKRAKKQKEEKGKIKGTNMCPCGKSA